MRQSSFICIALLLTSAFLSPNPPINWLCYSSKVIRNGIRVGDLRHMDTFPQKLEILLLDAASRFKDFHYGPEMLRNEVEKLKHVSLFIHHIAYNFTWCFPLMKSTILYISSGKTHYMKLIWCTLKLVCTGSIWVFFIGNNIRVENNPVLI